MFLNLFGEYLVGEGLINEDQFTKIKEAQNKTRVKLGLIAVSEKMLTEKQADEVNRKQAVMDKRFGDIAIELGYLTGDQVSKLLDLQGNAYMRFCQTANDLDILSLADIEKALEAYCGKYGFSAENKEKFKADDIDGIIPLFLDGIDKDTVDLVAVAVRTINRLISTDLSIGTAKKVDEYTCDYVAYQGMSGDFNILTAFSGSVEGVLKIADSFAGETFEQVDEDALDSVGEFINIVNGLYATALSYRKVKVELLAPHLVSTSSTLPDGPKVVVPLKIENKSVELVINVINA